MRFYMAAVIVVLILIAPRLGISANADFKVLKEEECQRADPRDIGKLPARFSKFVSWTKICPLHKSKDFKAVVYVISVWSEEFYQSQAGNSTLKMEEFPLPLIVDEAFSTLGELPELYPVNDTTFPQISFGFWVSAIPSQINVDVSNPAVDGDYFYPPLVWDASLHRYIPTPGQVMYGRRF